MAYYPDRHQERILGELNFSEYIDYYNIMCYDRN
jgi:hypothetical protein